MAVQTVDGQNVVRRDNARNKIHKRRFKNNASLAIREKNPSNTNKNYGMVSTLRDDVDSVDARVKHAVEDLVKAKVF